MTQNLKLVTNAVPSIEIDGETLIINSISISSKELVDFLNKESNQIEAFISLIDSALAIRKLASSTKEAEKLGATAEKLELKLVTVINDAIEDISEIIETQGNDEDPDALAGIVKKKILKVIADELKPSNPSSPFNSIAEELKSISETLLKNSGAKPAIDNSSKKGANFNQVMDGILQDLASICGDTATYTNDLPSETGSKEGDEVITIDPEISGGKELNIVWEFKAEKGLSQSAILREISSAMTNRHAVAGVFVVDREPKNQNWPAHSFHSGNRLILVVNKDDVDQKLIQFGYIWSRWVAVRNISNVSESIDLKKVSHLISELEVAMKEFAELKKAHTGIETSLTQARDYTGNIEAKLKTKILEILEVMKD